VVRSESGEAVGSHSVWSSGAKVARGILVHEYGAAQVLKPSRVEVGSPARGDLRLRQTFVGVNFHDVYVRSGLYQTLSLPGIPGVEGVGVVEEVGTGVEGFETGDRVGYIEAHYGGYASERLLSAARAIRLPPGLDDRTVAAVLLKGLTVEMLVRRVHRIREGDWVLVHAAAGGVGQLLVQWLKNLGAHVIGTVGSEEKAELARRAGCEQVVMYRREDVRDRVMEITGGRGVDVVYDSVGRDTFGASLESLAPCSHLVNFGQASGPVEPVALAQLAKRSSTLSRPIVFHYIDRRLAFEEMCASLFSVLEKGELRVETPRVFGLDEASAAHSFLESRASVTPIVLAV
jgi:NADPH:quinone reductase